MTRLEFAPQARLDLVDIGDYIALDHQGRALLFVQELRAACEELREAPLRFPALAGFEALGYRRRPFGRYSVIYVVRHETVSIIRILSAAMDLPSALGKS